MGGRVTTSRFEVTVVSEGDEYPSPFPLTVTDGEPSSHTLTLPAWAERGVSLPLEVRVVLRYSEAVPDVVSHWSFRVEVFGAGASVYSPEGVFITVALPPGGAVYTVNAQAWAAVTVIRNPVVVVLTYFTYDERLVGWQRDR